MKLLGKLKASSLQIGDIIQIAGYKTKVISVDIGVTVVVETEMFEKVKFDYCEKVSLYY